MFRAKRSVVSLRAPITKLLTRTPCPAALVKHKTAFPAGIPQCPSVPCTVRRAFCTRQHTRRSSIGGGLRSFPSTVWHPAYQGKRKTSLEQYEYRREMLCGQTRPRGNSNSARDASISAPPSGAGFRFHLLKFRILRSYSVFCSSPQQEIVASTSPALLVSC